MNIIAEVRNEMYRIRYFTVEELIDMLEKGKLSFLPKIKGRVGWKSSQQSRMLETILSGQPQPMLMIDVTDSSWVLMTGENELQAILRFVKSNFELNSLFYSSEEYEQKSFSELSYHMQRHFLNCKFMATLIDCSNNAFSRLWIYTTEFYRQGVFSQKACRMVIFRDAYGKLKEKAFSLLNVKEQEDNVWMLIVMRGILSTVECKELGKAGKLDIATFMSMCMIEADVMIDKYLNPNSSFAQRLPEMTNIIRHCHKTSGYTVKMRRCLAFILANYQWTDAASLCQKFKIVWKKYIDLTRSPYRGTSVESYLTCCQTMIENMKLQYRND